MHNGMAQRPGPSHDMGMGEQMEEQVEEPGHGYRDEGVSGDREEAVDRPED